MTKRVAVVEKILGANERLAAENRLLLDESATFGLNLMASPGAGKTSLIEQTLGQLRGRLNVAVIDGDVATTIDADRAAAAGAQAVQINTGGECHLDAVMVQEALEQLDLATIELLIVENIQHKTEWVDVVDTCSGAIERGFDDRQLHKEAALPVLNGLIKNPYAIHWLY